MATDILKIFLLHNPVGIVNSWCSQTV